MFSLPLKGGGWGGGYSPKPVSVRETATRFARKSDVSDLRVISAPISGKPDIDAQTDLPLSGRGNNKRRGFEQGLLPRQKRCYDAASLLCRNATTCDRNNAEEAAISTIFLGQRLPSRGRPY
jgi:hypothetical protein